MQIDTCYGHLSSTSAKLKSCAAAVADLQQPPERSSGWRAEMRHAILWENWQNKSSDS